MEGQFYRKIKTNTAVNLLAKRVFKSRRWALVVIGGTFVIAFVLFNNRGVVARIRLEVERREMIEKVREAEKETKRLQSYLKALDGDRKTIEKVAREKYGMAREGETVYKVKKD